MEPTLAVTRSTGIGSPIARVYPIFLSFSLSVNGVQGSAVREDRGRPPSRRRTQPTENSFMLHMSPFPAQAYPPTSNDVREAQEQISAPRNRKLEKINSSTKTRTVIALWSMHLQDICGKHCMGTYFESTALYAIPFNTREGLEFICWDVQRMCLYFERTRKGLRLETGFLSFFPRCLIYR